MYMRVCVHVCIHLCVYVHACSRMCACVCLCVCACVYTCVCVHVDKHTQKQKERSRDQASMHAVSACDTPLYHEATRRPLPPASRLWYTSLQSDSEMYCYLLFYLVYSQVFYYSNRLREGSKQKEERLNKILKTDDLEENMCVHKEGWRHELLGRL